MLGRRERLKGLLKSDRGKGGNAEIEKPKRSPRTSHMARGAGEMEADEAHEDRSEGQQGDGEWASQSEEATEMAGSGEELSCWP